jgi:hypothetical protein
MSVINGQKANAANLNAAFVSKTSDSTVTSILTLNHAGSAPAVSNVQDAINDVTSDVAAHLVDAVDAHDASAISFVPTGSIAATDVQAAIAEAASEADTALTNHLNDTSDAHDASAISSVASGNLVATDVQAALNELQSDIDTRATATALTDHISDATDAHAGSAITNTPSGNLSATTVQAALNELQTDVDGRIANSLVTTKGDLVTATASATPARLPVGTNGYFLTADSAESTGLKWVAASSGGGGGGSLVWIEDANAPIATVENKIRVYQFQSALAQTIHAVVKVPDSYVAGSQILLRTFWYSNDTSGTALIQSISTLIRAGVDAITSTANQRTSTNAAVTMSGATQNIPQAVELDVSSASGQINAVAISPGDLILISLTRGTDTGVSDVSVPVNCAEVAFS